MQNLENYSYGKFPRLRLAQQCALNTMLKELVHVKKKIAVVNDEKNPLYGLKKVMML